MSHLLTAARSLAPVLGLALLATPGAAQTPQLVLKRNDPILGNGNIQLFDQIVVNNDGLYYTDVTSDEVGFEDVILLNGFMVLVRGTAVAAPTGATFKSAVGGSMTVNSQGYIAWALNLNGTGNGKSDDSGVYWNTLLMAQEGAVPAVPEIGGIEFTSASNGGAKDTKYRNFTCVMLNDQNDMLVLGSLDDDGFKGSESCAYILRTDGVGNVQEQQQEFLAVRRYPLPATGETVDGVTATRDAWAFNDSGDWVGQVQISGSTVILKNGMPVVRSGEESPAQPGRNFTGFSNLGMNNNGDFVVSVLLDGAKSDNTAMVKNATDVVVTESDSFPALAPYRVVRFDGAPVKIADSGDVFWYAATDNQSAQDRYYFRSIAIGENEWEHTVVAQEGVTLAGGGPISELRTTTFAFEISDNGRFWLGEVLLANGTEGLLLADFGASVPIRGCTTLNEGTMQKVEGDPLIGTRVVYEVDGPIATGNRPVMLWSNAQSLPGSPCGVTAGRREIFINASPARVFGKLTGAAYAGAPLTFDIDLPLDVQLIDMTVYGQTFFRKPDGNSRVTNGVAMTIGAPN